MITVTFLYRSLKFHAADTGTSIIIIYQKIMLIKVKHVKFYINV